MPLEILLLAGPGHRLLFHRVLPRLQRTPLNEVLLCFSLLAFRMPEDWSPGRLFLFSQQVQAKYLMPHTMYFQGGGGVVVHKADENPYPWGCLCGIEG